MNKKTILFLDHAPIMGGAEISLLLLMKGLNKDSFNLVLVCPLDTQLAKEASGLGAKVIDIDLGRLRNVRNPFILFYRLAAGFWRLVRAIQKERVDIVHANTMRMSIYGSIAAKITGKPFVWHVRDIHNEGLYKSTIGLLADRIVAISGAVRKSLPRRFWNKITIIHNSIDMAPFEAVETASLGFRAKLGIPENAILIGNVGWISPVKELELFVEGAGRVGQRYPDTWFVVVGDAARERDKEYVEAQKDVSKKLLGHRIIWAGGQSNIVEVMSGLDILAHTARDEAFGMVLVEAMAAGKPVIGPAAGGPAEVVEDGTTGLLFKPGDPDALAMAIGRLLESPELARSLGEAGAKRARALFSRAREAREFEGLYQEIAGLLPVKVFP